MATWMLVLILLWGTPQMHSVVVARHLTWAQCTAMALAVLAQGRDGTAATCKIDEREA